MNKLSHVAFIMDGNGRWGKKEKRGRNYGHLKGVEIVKKVVEGSIRFKIKHLTFYVFSTENWKRPKSEIKYLFKLSITSIHDIACPPEPIIIILFFIIYYKFEIYIFPDFLFLKTNQQSFLKL